MRAGLVLPPSPTRHRRPRGPQETVEAAPESSRRALQMSNLARRTGRSPKEVMSDRAKRTTKRRTTYVVLHGLGDLSGAGRGSARFQVRAPVEPRVPPVLRPRPLVRTSHFFPSPNVHVPLGSTTETRPRGCPRDRTRISGARGHHSTRRRRPIRDGYRGVCAAMRDMCGVCPAAGRRSAPLLGLSRHVPLRCQTRLASLRRAPRSSTRLPASSRTWTRRSTSLRSASRPTRSWRAVSTRLASRRLGYAGTLHAFRTLLRSRTLPALLRSQTVSAALTATALLVGQQPDSWLHRQVQ
jgi:hypothetical protein